MHWSRATIDALFAEMRAEAEAVVRLGVPQGELVETRTGFMRYRGQGHEVAVPLPDGTLDPAALRAAFDATYARVYGRVIPRLEVEAVTWTLSLAEPHELPERVDAAAGCRRRSAESDGVASSRPPAAKQSMPRCSCVPSLPQRCAHYRPGGDRRGRHLDHRAERLSPRASAPAMTS